MPAKGKKDQGKKTDQLEKKRSKSKDIVPEKNEPSKLDKPIEIDDDSIDRTELYCTDPYDYVILLKCPEITAIVQACDFLYEYVIKYPDIGEKIVSEGAIEDVLKSPNYSHPYYNGTRYRFLSKLYEMFPQARRKLGCKIDFLRMAMKHAAEAHDVTLMAYSLLYCSTLTENFLSMLHEFIEVYGVDLLFNVYLPQSDIDVKYNALGLMKNMLDYKKTTLSLIQADCFSFVQLVDQCGCPYPAIQNRALDVIIKLLNCKEKQDHVHTLFIRAAGIDILLQLLNVFEWRDVHVKVQEALRILVCKPSHYEAFEDLAGIDKLSNYVNFILDDDLIAENLKTLLTIAHTSEGRMILLRQNTLEVFIDVINDGSQESKNYACEGIRLLANDTLGVIQLGQRDPSRTLILLMADSDNSPELRCNSACTLNVLAKSTAIAKLQLSRRMNFLILVKMLELPLQLTLECTCLVLETLSTLLSIPARLKKILTLELSTNILAIIDDDDLATTRLQQLALEVTTWTLARQIGRDWFIGLNGVCKIMKLLYRSKDPIVLNSVGLLLRMAVEQDTVLTEMFYKAGLVKWLIKNKSLWVASPRLETAMQTIFHCDPSVKFEYWGRLDVSDVTTDGFFCRRLERNESVNCYEVWRQDMCPYRPVYTVVTGVKLKPKQEDSISLFTFESTPDKKGDVNSFKQPKSAVAPNNPKLSHYSKKLISKSYNKRTTVLETDAGLRKMYLTLKKQFDELSSKFKPKRSRFSRSWMETGIRKIALVVHKALSGQYHKKECTYHTFELHIQELKVKLSSSLIPLGRLEVGLKLERALLFKVLADRLGVPCALARGMFSVAWIEVEIPEEEVVYPELPLEKAVTNHVVDLVTDPGRLMHLTTEEAKKYCGEPLPGVFQSLPRHLTNEKPCWMRYREKSEEVGRHIEIY